MLMWQNQIVHKKLKKVIKTYWVFSFSLDRELSYKTCQFGRKLGEAFNWRRTGKSTHIWFYIGPGRWRIKTDPKQRVKVICSLCSYTLIITPIDENNFHIQCKQINTNAWRNFNCPVKNLHFNRMCLRLNPPNSNWFYLPILR